MGNSNQRNRDLRDPVVYTMMMKSQKQRDREKRITLITAICLSSILAFWFIYCIYIYAKGS